MVTAAVLRFSARIFIQIFSMSKKKRKDENPVKSFLSGELYKIFNQHPNKTFNQKQLTKQVQSPVLTYFRKNLPGYAYIEDLDKELRPAVISLLEEMTGKGDLIETDRG